MDRIGTRSYITSRGGLESYQRELDDRSEAPSKSPETSSSAGAAGATETLIKSGELLDKFRHDHKPTKPIDRMKLLENKLKSLKNEVKHLKQEIASFSGELQEAASFSAKLQEAASLSTDEFYVPLPDDLLNLNLELKNSAGAAPKPL